MLHTIFDFAIKYTQLLKHENENSLKFIILHNLVDAI